MEVLNQTKLVHEKTMGMDADGREFLSFVFKGTWDFPDPSGGDAIFAELQTPLVMADEYTDEPGFSAPLWETDFAFRKPSAEVILQGAAYAPSGRKAERVRVGVQVDNLVKQFDVVGYREWQVVGPLIRATRAVPFQRMPFSYNTAFGGTVKMDPTDEVPDAYLANPVGRGFAVPKYQDRLAGLALPNTEEVGTEVTSPYEAYAPMAFGPIGRAWPVRGQYAGTYDQNYVDNIFPFLPPDFDERHYQTAPQDQWIRGVRSGAQVVLVGLTPAGREAFVLPKTNVPITLFRNGKVCLERAVTPDTLIIDSEARQFSLIWRIECRIQRNFLEFDTLWLGDPTEPMRRARAEGRTYIRVPAVVKPKQDDAA